MTCDHAEDAVPCEQSSQFHYLNELIGQGPNVPLHQEQDIERAAQYGSRTLSARVNLLNAERNGPIQPLQPQPVRPLQPIQPLQPNGRATPGRRRTRPRTRPVEEVIEVSAT